MMSRAFPDAARRPDGQGLGPRRLLRRSKKKHAMNDTPIAILIALAGPLLVGAAGGPAPRPADEKTDQGEPKAMLIQKDYEALTGRWQLVRSVVDGVPLPEAEVRKTVLITDHDKFRFPADAGVGTAPQGTFTIDPTKNPKQVDSTALAGPNKGELTLGIYEILDANNKRACFVRPGGPQPTDFTSTRGSGRTLQEWRLISKELGD
jgi:uncharacterized protein (TIGR03067 family)